MSTHAPAADYAPLVLDAQLRERLEELADAAGRSVSELAGAVLREFIDENESQLAAIDAGIAEADAGELYDYDVVKADIQKKLATLVSR